MAIASQNVFGFVPIRLVWHLKGERFAPVAKELGLLEDEQCQRIGGGHEAAKFGFLLFL